MTLRNEKVFMGILCIWRLSRKFSAEPLRDVDKQQASADDCEVTAARTWAFQRFVSTLSEAYRPFEVCPLGTESMDV